MIADSDFQDILNQIYLDIYPLNKYRSDPTDFSWGCWADFLRSTILGNSITGETSNFPDCYAIHGMDRLGYQFIVNLVQEVKGA